MCINQIITNLWYDLSVFAPRAYSCLICLIGEKVKQIDWNKILHSKLILCELRSTMYGILSSGVPVIKGMVVNIGQLRHFILADI